jgi:lipopolysaccharide biosynthesis protein
MSDVRVIAYYLPQFHPIPENDEWWGKGFTEWTNVTRARPWFEGHAQPHLPADLGFYDLRLGEARAAQATLARAHGVHGFCYYYYWFNGRRILNRPLDQVLASGEPDFPFCICWANENWTRRWDGAEHEILLHQEHTPESDRAFILDVIPLLKDRRYIRVGGAPLLLVYRPGIIPDAPETTRIWREVARAHGIPDLHLCAVQSFGFGDPRPLGFDSAAEFPPHGCTAREIADKVPGLDPKFEGKIFDFRDLVRGALTQAPVEYLRYRGVMTSWDNTARRGPRGNVFHHSSPEEYELWLRTAIATTETTNPPEARFVFVNAWNEWAEGAHLEPDARNGRAYLEATARGVAQRSDWRAVLEACRDPDLTPQQMRGYLADLEFALKAYDRSVSYLVPRSGNVQRSGAVISPHLPLRYRLIDLLHERVKRATPGLHDVAKRFGAWVEGSSRRRLEARAGGAEDAGKGGGRVVSLKSRTG